jgi:diguanylate cyclase (GGDEF)-like protein
MQPSTSSQEGQLETRSLRFFILYASLAAALCVTGGFLGMAYRNRQLIQEEMLNRGRMDFANIVLMRHWNASYGGVYVEKKPGMVSNPFLEHPDITDTTGKVYTLKNPALMTRELSEQLEKNLGYAFHITSLKPLNPANGADPEERKALLAFEQGLTERSWTEQMGDKTFYRYMGPLKTEASCLVCHAKQGYKAGDIRGGISVSFDVHELEKKLRTNLATIVALSLLTTTLLVGSLLLLFRQMVARLREARNQLVTLATTDGLTGLLNRRSILQRLEQEMERTRRHGEPLGCILLDVDFFKQVNDRFGHAAGDEVLRRVARVLKDMTRPYDAVGRFGGEEFLVILPNTDRETLRIVAERLRTGLPEQVQTGEPASPLPITASFGTTVHRAGESTDTFIARADRGMYLAKSHGRNRVEEDEA